MPVPRIKLTINRNGIGRVAASVGRLQCKLAVSTGGTPNTMYTIGSPADAQAQLGAGPLVEMCADTLDTAGGPVFAIPLTPSIAGSVGATTHSGTGAGTVVGLSTSAPTAIVDLKIEVGGNLGTMTFRWRVAGAQYSDPVATQAGGSFAYRVPGTLTTVTFTDHSFTAADVWTISTLGVVTHTGSGTTGWMTQASSPLDDFNVVVTITGDGAAGAATFQVSVDGNVNKIGPILVPSSGSYAVQGTGIVLTFSSTFVTGDTYTFAATCASAGNTDVVNALTALLAQQQLVGFVHVGVTAASAAAAVSMAGAVDAKMSEADSVFRYMFAIVQTPTVEVDSTIVTAAANFASDRVMMTVGDFAHVSAISGRVIRRNAAVAVATRLGAIKVSESPGWVGSTAGSLPRVQSLYANFGAATWTPDTLNDGRFTTLTKFPDDPGYFVTDGLMMAVPGTDFESVMNRRVMDRASQLTRRAMLPHLNESFSGNPDGTLLETEARKVENGADQQLRSGLLGSGDISPPAQGQLLVQVDRAERTLVTDVLGVTIGIIPKGYAKQINVTIGFVVESSTPAQVAA